MNHTRETFAGLCAALIITVAINFPMLRAIVLTNEWQFADIVQESSDESFYLTRIREVADGHPMIGHPYIAEKSDQLYPLGQLNEWILGTAMRFFDLRLKTIAFAADLFFPFLLSYLLWIATRSILPQRRWRLLLLALVFLGTTLTAWKRPISPQMVTVLPLLYLWGILTPHRTRLSVATLRSGLIGLMLYSYPYHWTYCLIMETLLTLADLRHTQTWRVRWHRLLTFLLPVALLAIPWIGMNLLMQGNIAYQQLLIRLGLQHSHLPTGPAWQIRIVLIGLLVLFVVHRTRQKDLQLPLLLPLLAGLFVFNQTLLTGSELEFSSHYSRLIQIPLWTGLLVSLSLLLKKLPYAARSAAYGGLCVVLLSTICVTRAEMQTFQTITPPLPIRQQHAAIIDALNALPGEQVILTDLAFSQDITLYTNHYPFFAPQTHMYLLPNEDIQKRAAAVRFLLPDEPLSPRMVFGASYANRALNERARCIVFGWIGKADVDRCAKTAEEYLPASWSAIRDGTTLNAQEIMDVLTQTNVRYILLRTVPPLLQPHLIPITTFENYQLYELRS